MDRPALWGDAHTHSHYSDGLYAIPEQTPHYESFGLDWRFQTDHHLIRVPEGKAAGKWLQSADWERYAADCRAASNARHLCIPAVELGWIVAKERNASEGWFHTKLHPPSGAPIPDESFYAGRDYVNTIRACKEAGYRTIVAHIDQGAPLERFDGSEIDGLEVRLDIEERRPFFARPNLKHWDRMLSAGRRISLSSGSDAHQPDLWAGSGLRTVVLDTPFEADAIVDAVVAGRAYLSGTWHADAYAELGWPARPNPVDNGASITHMVPWWEFKQYPLLSGREPKAVVEEVYARALQSGRVRREDHPVLDAFRVGTATCGGTAAAQQHEALIAFHTHVPLKALRLIADGATVFDLPPGQAPLGATEGRLSVPVDLRGKRYVRLELEAQDPAAPECVEILAGNPVYLS
ncbi:MAG: hypothetical protein AMXMBFR7_37890 [Planctomycetota bacterium]